MSRLTVYGGGLPSGGTAGQTLQADGAGGGVWATVDPAVSPFHLPIGQWATNGRLAVGANATNQAKTVNQLTLSPLWNSEAMTLDQVEWNVNVAATAAHLEVGFYTVDDAFTTATLLADFGPLDASVTGNKLVTGLSLKIGAKTWVATLADVAVTLAAVPSPPLFSHGGPNLQNDHSAVNFSRAYGALPATLTLATGTGNGINIVPACWYHRSA